MVITLCLIVIGITKHKNSTTTKCNKLTQLKLVKKFSGYDNRVAKLFQLYLAVPGITIEKFRIYIFNILFWVNISWIIVFIEKPRF